MPIPEETTSNQEDFSDHVLTRENFSSVLGEFSDILFIWKANLQFEEFCLDSTLVLYKLNYLHTHFN